jgi:galactonate dehydratase
MKITSVKPIVVYAGKCNWVFVQIETDDGLTGLGEGSLLGHARTIAAGIEDAAGYLLGNNPLNPQRIWRQIWESDRYRGGPILMSVISAIDMACWDIVGKHAKLPVWQLLGGACRDRVRLYGRLSFAGSAQDNAALATEQGYTAIKFGFTPPDDDKIDEATVIDACVAQVHEMREAVGPDVGLCLDTHSILSLQSMIKLMVALEPFNLIFVEEPVPPEDLEGLRYLRTHTATPMASGERLLNKYDFRELIDGALVDYVQPDIVHCGGITELIKIAAIAEAKHIALAPHNPSSHSELATMASLHVDASCPNFAIQEHPANYPAWRYDIFNERIDVQDGYALLPDRPGLGLTLKQDIADAHPYQSYTRVSYFHDDGSPAAS